MKFNLRNYNTDSAQLIERSGKRYIEGYAALFFTRSDSGSEYFDKSKDWYERIDRNAFNLNQEHDVYCCYDHKSEFMLGSKQEGTLALELEERGLKYSQLFDENDPDHIRTAKLIERGQAKGSSIGMWVLRASEGNEGPYKTFTIHEAIIRDVGPCAFPCYKSATALFRSSSEEAGMDYETWRRITAFSTK